jgi:hypothetical protein
VSNKSRVNAAAKVLAVGDTKSEQPFGSFSIGAMAFIRVYIRICIRRARSCRPVGTNPFAMLINLFIAVAQACVCLNARVHY